MAFLRCNYCSLRRFNYNITVVLDDLTIALFLANYYTYTCPISNTLKDEEIEQNIKTNHTIAVMEYRNTRPDNKILESQTPDILFIEEILNRSQRLLAQIRTNKSPFLQTYKHKIDPITNPPPPCPLCSEQPHDTIHLFQCKQIPTTLTPHDL